MWKQDWPNKNNGTIDLKIDDLPHSSATTEWWYVNSHLSATRVDPSQEREQNQDQKYNFSLFASFFNCMYDKQKEVKKYDQFVTWGITNMNENSYFFDCLLGKEMPNVVKNMFKDEKSRNFDHNIRKSFLEMVENDMDNRNFPGPDRVVTDEKDVRLSMNTLDIQVGTCSFKKIENNVYHVICKRDDQNSFDLKFTPSPRMKPPIRHGDNGKVNMGYSDTDENCMFYYSLTRLQVSGELVSNGIRYKISESESENVGWYDHQFGSFGIENNDNDSRVDRYVSGKNGFGWNWFGCQFPNEEELTITQLFDEQSKEIKDQYAIIIDKSGEYKKYKDITLTPTKHWTSVRTGSKYPIHWELKIHSLNIRYVIRTSMDNQEFITFLSKPSFYEGRIEIQRIDITDNKDGMMNGLGFIESCGQISMNSLNSFFKNIGDVVHQEIDKFLPLNADSKQVTGLLAESTQKTSSSLISQHCMDGIDINVFNKYMIEPLRNMIDRGGKMWRSYAIMLCIDVVGGSSDKFRELLVPPEILQVGSLIIDDIQDGATTRRGGPCCHLLYGNELTINAGSYAYFLGLIPFNEHPLLTRDQKELINHDYNLVLRAGHCGQMFDIRGFNYMCDTVIESGDSSLLEKRIYATHRLKTAIPPSILAKYGATIGGGTKEQVEALQFYFEDLGIAFQIIDDVLNLRGQTNRGEDLKAGKITYPIARALGRITSKQDRERICKIILSKPQDQKTINSICDEIESCGALISCDEQAIEMIESAWKKLSPLLSNTIYKLILRAFGFFLLKR